VLGVSQQASQDEIKKAYNNLMRYYHPDKNENGIDMSQVVFKREFIGNM
jgi:DnaJ-class molecular chaperone